MKRLSLLVAAVCLSGCAYPVSMVQQGREQSSIYVPNAPLDATVEVDGAAVGPAIAADGKKPSVFPVVAGTHRVVVKGAAGPLFNKDIYVGAGSKVAVEITR